MAFFDDLVSSVSGVGPLLTGVTSVIGEKQKANAINQASAAENAHRQQIIDLARGGVSGPTGSTSLTNEGLRTDLSPGQQTLFNEFEGLQTGAANAGSNLINAGSQFDPTSTVLPTGFSLDSARGIVNRDNALAQEHIINPALDRATTAETRRAGGTSNFGSPGSALDTTIGNIQGSNLIGGDQKALALFNQQADQFIKNSLGLGPQLAQIAGTANPAIASTASLGDLTNLTNSISGQRPASNVADPTIPAIGNAIGGLLTQQQASEERERAKQVQDRLLEILSKSAADKGQIIKQIPVS